MTGVPIASIGIIGLQGVSIGLFARRTRHGDGVQPQDWLVPVPSLAASSILVALAPPSTRWPWALQALFAGGAVFAIAALVTLGGSFGVVPAHRGLVTSGPFAVVRHPAYLGELVMTACCAAAVLRAGQVEWWQVVAPCTALGPAVWWRVRREEQVMATDPCWRSYRDRTRFRLVPLVW